MAATADADELYDTNLAPGDGGPTGLADDDPADVV
jgi:hypothetical protein